jgi:hypothetical protein
MPGKSKKGGGLESSPVYKKQKFGEAKSPFNMKGHSGFGNSPAKQTDTKKTKPKVQPVNPAGPKGHGWNPQADPSYISEKLVAGKYGMPEPWGAGGPSIRIGDTKSESEPKKEPHTTYVDSPEVIAARTGKSYGLKRTSKKLKPKKKNIVKSFVDFAKSKKK